MQALAGLYEGIKVYHCVYSLTTGTMMVATLLHVLSLHTYSTCTRAIATPLQVSLITATRCMYHCYSSTCTTGIATVTQQACMYCTECDTVTCVDASEDQYIVYTCMHAYMCTLSGSLTLPSMSLPAPSSAVHMGQCTAAVEVYANVHTDHMRINHMHHDLHTCAHMCSVHS